MYNRLLVTDSQIENLKQMLALAETIKAHQNGNHAKVICL